MIYAHVPNLLDRSRFRGDVHFLTSPPGEVPSGSIIIVDLDRTEDPLEWVDAESTMIGFGAHVAAERLQAMRDGGYTMAFARSEFFRRLPELLEARGG